MKNFNNLTKPAAVVAILAIITISVLISGAMVLLVWNLFHLANIVHLTYWQATGIAIILGGFSANTVTSRK